MHAPASSPDEWPFELELSKHGLPKCSLRGRVRVVWKNAAEASTEYTETGTAMQGSDGGSSDEDEPLYASMLSVPLYATSCESDFGNDAEASRSTADGDHDAGDDINDGEGDDSEGLQACSRNRGQIFVDSHDSDACEMDAAEATRLPARKRLARRRRVKREHREPDAKRLSPDTCALAVPVIFTSAQDADVERVANRKSAPTTPDVERVTSRESAPTTPTAAVQAPPKPPRRPLARTSRPLSSEA